MLQAIFKEKFSLFQKKFSLISELRQNTPSTFAGVHHKSGCQAGKLRSKYGNALAFLRNTTCKHGNISLFLTISYEKTARL